MKPTEDELAPHLRKAMEDTIRWQEQQVFRLDPAFVLPTSTDRVDWNDTTMDHSPLQKIGRGIQYTHGGTYMKSQQADNGLRLYVDQQFYLNHRPELARLMRRVDFVTRCEANYASRSFDLDVCVNSEIRIPPVAVGSQWPEARVYADRVGKVFKLVVKLVGSGDVLWTSE